jgi:lysine 2,3-aminomutase
MSASRSCAAQNIASRHVAPPRAEFVASNKTLNSADAVIASGLAPTSRKDLLDKVAARYAIAIPPAMQALIDRDDADDPIARQFVPDARELNVLPFELLDPIGDDAKSPVAGIVHRYPDRVLLKIVGVCPVYCRFCFRREMVGPNAGRNLGVAEIEAALGYIQEHPEIWEVILTGGDPFVLSAKKAADITRRIEAIDHVKVIRWHTRVPIVAPETVTPAFAKALKSERCAVFVGLHANHPREMTVAARAAIARIVDHGIPVVSQSVLLRGVNDSVDTLEALMRAFIEARVTPYYLHHGDLAPGTSHFRTTIAEGQALMRDLRRRLSGIAMPDYVLDIPGAHGKVPIGPDYDVVEHDDGSVTVRDRDGVVRTYGVTPSPASR